MRLLLGTFVNIGLDILTSWQKNHWYHAIFLSWLCRNITSLQANACPKSTKKHQNTVLNAATDAYLLILNLTHIRPMFHSHRTSQLFCTANQLTGFFTIETYDLTRIKLPIDLVFLLITLNISWPINFPYILFQIWTYRFLKCSFRGCNCNHW